MSLGVIYKVHRVVHVLFQNKR